MSADIKNEAERVCSYDVDTSGSFVLSYDCSESASPKADNGRTESRRMMAGSMAESAPCAVMLPISSWSKQATRRIDDSSSSADESSTDSIRLCTAQ